MGVGMSGMISGMDTDSIVKAMVSGYTSKVEKTTKEQTRLQWKMDAWKSLNTKVYDFYSKTMSNLRFASSYAKKATSISDSTIAKITASNTCVNGTQTLAVKQLAKSGYLTGSVIQNVSDSSKKLTKSSKLSDLGITEESSFVVGSGDNETTITVNGDTKISDLLTMLNDAGVGASFDEKNQRFFISAKESGEMQDFALIGDNKNGAKVLEALGLKSNTLSKSELEHYKKWASYTDKDLEKLTDGDLESNKARRDMAKAYIAQYDYMQKKAEGTVDSATENAYNESVKKYGELFEKEDEDGNGSKRIYGQDAIIYLNGAKFQSNDNIITVNGLTINATETTGVNDDGTLRTVSITTSDDTDAMYDLIRDFLSEYNSLINEMDKLYSADSSRGYEPLTDDEKKEMSEDEIEKWESKIKDSLLRRDTTLSSISQMMKSTMQQGIKVGDRTYYLSDFGIGTQSYFSAPDNQKSSLHIDGDEEDSVTAGKTDKLRNMIANDPDTVASFFSQLVTDLYGKVSDKMKKTELSSSYTLYNDTQMQSEYSQYSKKIKEQQQKVAYWEEYYYSQFTAMETALAKLNSQQSSLAGLLSS